MMEKEDMGLSSNFKLQGSSLVESIIALVIVAVCLSIALVVYVKVLKSQRDIPFYSAEQKVKELFWITKEESLWEDGDYSYDTYTIKKKVEKLDGMDTVYKLTFMVITPGNQKKIEHVAIP